MNAAESGILIGLGILAVLFIVVPFIFRTLGFLLKMIFIIAGIAVIIILFHRLG